MTTQPPTENATELPLALRVGVGARSNPTNRQIEVTMFSAGSGRLEEVKGKLGDQG